MLLKKVTIHLLTMSVLLSSVAQAKNPTKSKMVAANARNLSKLSTDIHFDGVNVSGRRQSPFEASAIVENDKKTPTLIDYRDNYNDRVERSKSGR